MLDDPLTSNDRFRRRIFCVRRFRGRDPWSCAGDIIVLLAGIIIFLMIPVGVFWSGFATPDKDTLEKLLAAVAAVLALVGVLYTIRAKVRSENRQKWIDEVRKNLAIVINYAGYKNALYDSSHVQTGATGLQRFNIAAPPYLYPEANLARLTLELLINPSEKDHRTLSTLLRLLCEYEPIEIDREVTKELPFLVTTPKPNHRTLITWTIRLSNAMLKREWELVKFGK
jgi:hypothetical protein